MRVNVGKKSPSLTFPQANDVKKIIKMGDIMSNGTNQKDLRFINLDITTRQISYYYSSGVFLGLFKKQKNKELTRLGSVVFSQDISVVMRLVVFLILEDFIFFDYYKNRDLNSVEKNIKEHYHLSGSTLSRRAENVKSWIEWCDVIINEQKIFIEEGELERN